MFHNTFEHRWDQIISSQVALQDALESEWHNKKSINPFRTYFRTWHSVILTKIMKWSMSWKLIPRRTRIHVKHAEKNVKWYRIRVLNVNEHVDELYNGNISNFNRNLNDFWCGNEFEILWSSQKFENYLKFNPFSLVFTLQIRYRV